MKTNVLASILLCCLFTACSGASGSRAENQTDEKEQPSQTEESKDLSGLSRAYFASGCFWCVEAVFESVKGVEEAVSGYAGGEKKNPTYREVSSGTTRHAEAVEVYYDSSVVDYPTLLRVFFGSHDPTTLNRQGPDRGPQYRSMILYQNEQEKTLANKYIQKLTAEKTFEDPIVTEVEKLEKFWPAEDYHQDYEQKHPNEPYVQSVSIPRLREFQRNHKELLKPEALEELESH